MAFIVHNNKNYVTTSIHHLRDTSLSLQAMGLLSFMLSCADTFKFSIEGLTKISSCGDCATRSALKELRDKNYVVVAPVKKNSKIVEWNYHVYEKPFVGNPDVDSPDVENPHVENQGQRNISIEDTSREVEDKDKSLSLFNSSNEESNAVDTHTCESSYQWLIDYWNEHAAVKGYPRLISIAGNRLKAVRARIKEYGKEQFMHAIDKAAASDFLRGQNKNNFMLTFDWLTKPSNFPKVLEGNYDNKSQDNGTGNNVSGLSQHAQVQQGNGGAGDDVQVPHRQWTIIENSGSSDPRATTKRNYDRQQYDYEQPNRNEELLFGAFR